MIIVSTWQQLEGLAFMDHVADMLSQNQASTLHSPIYTEMPSDFSISLEHFNASIEQQDGNWEFHDVITGETSGVATS